MQELLNQLKIKADVVSVDHSGSMSKYYLRLRPGGRVSKIERCAEEIALGLKSQIAQTDKEINAMVYKLYELTEDEISIVEGA